MLKIAICDDEKILLDEIYELVKNEFAKLGTNPSIKVFSTGAELLRSIDYDTYDVVFLDIELQDANGIDIAKDLRENAYKGLIVFITSFVNYAIAGYAVDAFRYILKDNMDAELKNCINMIVNKFGLKKIEFKGLSLNLEDLIYIESYKHKIIFHLKNGEQKKIYDSLNNIQKEFNYQNLLRIHQSYLVNIMYVKSIKYYNMTLSNDVQLPIPKAKYSEIKRKLNIKKELWG